MSFLEKKPGSSERSKFFYGYIIALASFGLQVVIWGIVLSFGVFFKPLEDEFGWRRATISGASSLSLLFSGFTGILLGSLNDRYGPRILMVACGVFLGAGFLLMSRVDAVWQLYLFWGVIIGMGVSGTDVVLLSTVARWFVSKRGMMSGIVMIGTGLGMLVMPLVSSGLISAHGWRMAYIILGSAMLLFVISVAQLLRKDPAQMRQLPEGGGVIPSASPDLSAGGLSLGRAIHTRQFWALCVSYLTITFCANVVLVHIAPHAADIGFSMTEAAGVLSTVGGVSMLGRLVMGTLSDRIGCRWAMLGCFLLFVIVFAWLQVAGEMWMLYLFAVVYGFAHGGFYALSSPIVAELFGISSHGAIYGIVLFSAMAGGAAGPVFAGHIFDISGNYQIAFLACNVISLVGLVLTATLKPIGKSTE